MTISNEAKQAAEVIAELIFELNEKFGFPAPRRIERETLKHQLSLIMQPSFNSATAKRDAALAEVARLRTALKEVQNQCDYFADGAPDASPRDYFANELLGIIDPVIGRDNPKQ